MWWCCGKRNLDAVGCISQKHQSKEDEEEAEDIIQNKEDIKEILICACCKKKGHILAECPFDPNYRTKYSLNGETNRLTNLEEQL